jgi:hypothetical protein
MTHAHSKTANEARKHHYAPQFYLRQFACDTGRTEAMALTRQHDFVVGEPKAISHMGYEDDLHAIETMFGRTSIEARIGREIEDPISKSPTWALVLADDHRVLGEGDIAILYLLCRHLERRNLATLKFIESEQVRVRQANFKSDYTAEERHMHDALTATPNGGHAFFLEGALQTGSILQELDEVGITVCHSTEPLRSSTNPALTVPLPPGEQSRRCASGQPARAWWLPLSRHCGALVSLGCKQRGLIHEDGEAAFVRKMNQLYLVQLLTMPAVRYCLADDPHIDEDLVWAGYQLVRRGERKLRYIRADR